MDNAWKAWARQITRELEGLVMGVESNHAELAHIKALLENRNTTSTRTQIKAAVWGLLAGAVPVTIMLIFQR